MHPTVTYNIHTKFQLYRIYRLDTRTLLKNRLHRPKCIRIFFHSCKKTISPTFNKINTVRLTLTYNKYAKFELNIKHRLNTIVFIRMCRMEMHANTHEYPFHSKNSTHGFRRLQNRYVKISKSDFFHYYNTFLAQFGKLKKNYQRV